MSALLGKLMQRAYDPTVSAPGRRCELLLGILRDWGEPLTTRELVDLTDIPLDVVATTLALLEAEGRAGRVGRSGRRYLWIADPPLDLPHPHRPALGAPRSRGLR